MIPGTGISIGGEGTERFNSDLVQLGPRLERTGVQRRLTTIESFCADYNIEKDVRPASRCSPSASPRASLH